MPAQLTQAIGLVSLLCRILGLGWTPDSRSLQNRRVPELSHYQSLQIYTTTKLPYSLSADTCQPRISLCCVDIPLALFPDCLSPQQHNASWFFIQLYLRFST